MTYLYKNCGNTSAILYSIITSKEESESILAHNKKQISLNIYSIIVICVSRGRTTRLHHKGILFVTFLAKISRSRILQSDKIGRNSMQLISKKRVNKRYHGLNFFQF